MVTVCTTVIDGAAPSPEAIGGGDDITVPAEQEPFHWAKAQQVNEAEEDNRAAKAEQIDQPFQPGLITRPGRAPP